MKKLTSKGNLRADVTLQYFDREFAGVVGGARWGEGKTP